MEALYSDFYRKKLKRQRIKAGVVFLMIIGLLVFGGCKAAALTKPEYAQAKEVSVPVDQAPLELPAGTIREVTAYTSEVGQTDSTPCISANGSDICQLFNEGQMTCASNDYAFGTVLEIDGYGTCTVRDRMARKNDGKIDIYFGNDRKRALEFGRRILNVKEL